VNHDSSYFRSSQYERGQHWEEQEELKILSDIGIYRGARQTSHEIFEYHVSQISIRVCNQLSVDINPGFQTCGTAQRIRQLNGRYFTSFSNDILA